MTIRPLLIALAIGAGLAPVPGSAAPVETTAAPPVTVEYYYRIRWGSAGEFKRLYARNHAPLLAAMQKAGFVRSVTVSEPFTHLAGGPRWDLRVTIVFRDAAAAISDPAWDRLWAEETRRQFPDAAAFAAEEDRRFALLEDHWDVVVVPVTP